MDEACYLASRPRLLFVGKDTNDGNDHTSQWRMDKCCREKAIRARQENRWPEDMYYQRIGAWSWGILNGFGKAIDDLTAADVCDALLRVAITNLKKTAGGAVADKAAVRECATEPPARALLRYEIQVLQPDVLLCGGHDAYDVFSDVMDLEGIHVDPIELPFERRGAFVRGVTESDRLVAVDFWHPSARVSWEEPYGQLTDIWRCLVVRHAPWLAAPTQPSTVPGALPTS